MITLNRIAPKMGPAFYKSYAIRMPLTSHWREASCAEYGCEAFLYGWVTTVDITTELGRRQYDYITHDRSRRCTECKAGDALVEFTYGPGYKCFSQADHRVQTGREPLYQVRGGDYRGNPRGEATVAHRSIEDWVSDFSEHQEKLSRAQQ